VQLAVNADRQLADGTMVGNPVRIIQVNVDAADFTDTHPGATCYLDITEKVPAGSVFLGWVADVSEAFDADTSCAIDVGTSGTLDLFSDDTRLSVLTVGKKVSTVNESLAHADRNPAIPTETTIRITLTGGSDGTLVIAGDGVMTFTFIYLYVPVAV
jgi:hypothetical protein